MTIALVEDHRACDELRDDSDERCTFDGSVEMVADRTSSTWKCPECGFVHDEDAPEGLELDEDPAFWSDL
jgi:rubrerythrin